MTLQEIIPYIKDGHWGMLPNYKGYFKYNYYRKCIYMQNGDYINYNLDDVSHRTDFYYII